MIFYRFLEVWKFHLFCHLLFMKTRKQHYKSKVLIVFQNEYIILHQKYTSNSIFKSIFKSVRSIFSQLKSYINDRWNMKFALRATGKKRMEESASHHLLEHRMSYFTSKISNNYISYQFSTFWEFPFFVIFLFMKIRKQHYK